MSRLAACAFSVFAAAGIAGAEGLPFDVGGPFTLTDHRGQERSEVDPDGNAQLVFFGYANCQQVCSAALPMMAEVAETLEADGLEISPIMITVDPKRDTVSKIGAPLKQHHPDFIGLTGSEDALQVAYDAYSVEKEEIFFDPEFGPVFSHGSFIYLLDAKGEVLTLFPPILAPEAAAEIVTKYVKSIG
ncbi:SCO family protein [Litoreibacter roseus]|uniref:Protein SCO1/2 n=1 Tax=Litoreibacter roseus TaxID=2601869 RepID=A0A6N6JCP3_9RHOB|nr:SCO family protein [Litoreibacter roseus]GFE63925.1 hypothetical protein KIN_09990 [Litoreibacter roseus]